MVKDGSTVIFRDYADEAIAAGFSASNHYVFDPPLVGSTNTALNVACITTGSKVYVNAHGYMGV